MKYIFGLLFVVVLVVADYKQELLDRAIEIKECSNEALIFLEKQNRSIDAESMKNDLFKLDSLAAKLSTIENEQLSFHYHVKVLSSERNLIAQIRRTLYSRSEVLSKQATIAIQTLDSRNENSEAIKQNKLELDAHQPKLKQVSTPEKMVAYMKQAIVIQNKLEQKIIVVKSI